MEATWNGALFSAATIRLPVSTQSSRRAFGKAVVQRRYKLRLWSWLFCGSVALSHKTSDGKAVNLIALLTVLQLLIIKFNATF